MDNKIDLRWIMCPHCNKPLDLEILLEIESRMSNWKISKIADKTGKDSRGKNER